MFTGININETRRITLKLDPDKDNPTYFTIGILDSLITSYIEDKTTSYDLSGTDERMRIDSARRNILTVKFGLRGIDNFLHPETKQPVVFEAESFRLGEDIYPAVKDNILKLIPPEVIQELSLQIINSSRLSRQEIKN